MKHLHLLVWLTQLGISAAAPLTGFILLGIWLHRQWGLGIWTVPAGIFSGIAGAAGSLRAGLKAMERAAAGNEQEPPPVSFNTHE